MARTDAQRLGQGYEGFAVAARRLAGHVGYFIGHAVHGGQFVYALDFREGAVAVEHHAPEWLPNVEHAGRFDAGAEYFRVDDMRGVLAFEKGSDLCGYLNGRG